MSPRDVLEASRAGDEKALRRALSAVRPLVITSRLGRGRVVIHHDDATPARTLRPPRSDRPPVPLAGFRVDRDPPRVVDRPDDRRRPAPPRRRARIPRVRRDAPRERPDPPLPPRDDERAVPLHYAAARGHDVIVRALLHAGAVPDARDDRGRTPAHYAAGAARRGALASLLDAGARPDARDEDGRTPAHYAACADDAASVEELVARGANVDAMSARGMTPSDDARARGDDASPRRRSRDSEDARRARGANRRKRGTNRRAQNARERWREGAATVVMVKYGWVLRGGSGLAGTTPGSTRAAPEAETAFVGDGADGTTAAAERRRGYRYAHAHRPAGESSRVGRASSSARTSGDARAARCCADGRGGGGDDGPATAKRRLGDTKSAFPRRYGLQETPGLFRPDECD